MENLTEIFCAVDDYFQIIEKEILKSFLPNKTGKNIQQQCRMALSEIMTILIVFHQSHFRDFKAFYSYLRSTHKSYFPQILSYTRFVEVTPTALIPLLMFLDHCKGECTGISFIDSTVIRVCHIKREKRNKVFKNLGAKSKSTMGWFFGFKLHFTINEKGEILSYQLTPGNVDDRKPLEKLSKDLFGKLYGDKGYISQEKFLELLSNGVHLVTPLKKNMKNKLLPVYDKLMLRKRSLIETINDSLKNVCQVEHTRHRSVFNFFTNMSAGLVAYCFMPKKPSITNLPVELLAIDSGKNTVII